MKNVNFKYLIICIGILMNITSCTRDDTDDAGAKLTPSEKSALKAFILTLTDGEFLTNPAFSKPEDLP